MENIPKTPNRKWQPYVESPIDGKVATLSPAFKGKASEVGTRESLQRTSKDFTNFLRSTNRRGNVIGLNAGGSHQEGSEDTGGSEDEGEGHDQPQPGKEGPLESIIHPEI